jgi:serine/threonine protein kinase
VSEKLRQRLQKDRAAHLLPQIGDVIGDKYILSDVLGEGGFAWVYRARHIELETLEFAVKVLKPMLSADEQVAARFRREAHVVASLRSRHVVRLMDFGETPGMLLYLVMELVDGSSLFEWIHSKGVLPADRVAQITRQVLKALVEAHGKGIVHRDLKPDNIMMVNEPGEPFPVAKVVDFGIAKLLESEDEGGNLTKTGHFVCTPSYASPELLLGSPEPASDLYALGHTMLEMLEGMPPYNEGSAMAIAQKHMTSDPVPISTHVEASGLRSIIATACAKSLDKRFTSASEMLSALTVWVSYETGETVINGSLDDLPSQPFDSAEMALTVTAAETPSAEQPLPGATPDKALTTDPTLSDNVQPFLARHRWEILVGSFAMIALLSFALSQLMSNGAGEDDTQVPGEDDTQVPGEDDTQVPVVIEQPVPEIAAIAPPVAPEETTVTRDASEAVGQASGVLGGLIDDSASRIAVFTSEQDHITASVNGAPIGELPLIQAALPTARPLHVSFERDGYVREEHVVTTAGIVVFDVELERERERRRETRSERRRTGTEGTTPDEPEAGEVIDEPAQPDEEPEEPEEPAPNPFRNIRLSGD